MLDESSFSSFEFGLRLARKGEGRTSPETHDPHFFGWRIATLCGLQALSQRERDGTAGVCHPPRKTRA